MIRAASRETRKLPLAMTSCCRSQSCSVVSSSGFEIGRAAVFTTRWTARSARVVPRRGAPRARRRRDEAPRGDVSQQRRQDPLPLGSDGELPYSKGLLARALMGTGVSAGRAYELALRVESDLSARSGEAIDFDRLEELAREVLGEN